MNKKAIDFTFTTLIALGIVVFLVVVSALILTGNMKIFYKTNECIARKGYCTTNCEYAILYLDGCKEDEVCCYKPS